MSTYEEWNRLLVNYFLQGVPRGSKIYLNVDEDVLEQVGQCFSSSPLHGSWVDDFKVALRQKVLTQEDQEVSLDILRNCNSLKVPNGVGFLSACVLAASQMANEEDISELNYFKRLRKILGVKGSPRPKGMKTGAEEPLWLEWNRWLLKEGFQPSAYPGNGRQKYINYPISQCLLRRADKDKLQHIFAEKHWDAQWDAQTLYVQVRREKQALSTHLQNLLEDKRRHEAVVEAIHEVYEQWKAQGSPSTPRTSRSQRTWSPNLFAGLYRTEDPILGEVEYYLYPRQQRGRKLESVQVQYQDGTHYLQEDRSGWYLPIGEPLTINEIECGVKCLISNPSTLDKLILPARDFWILTPDPENPDSGIYASWGTPELGTPFILLCKEELLKDLEKLKDERLLEWDGEPYPIDSQSSWIELDQCMVLSQTWDGVFVENQALKNALQPKVSLSISFSGGLRIPQQRGWLEGYPPQVTVFGFSPKVELEVIDLIEERELLTRSQNTNQPYSLDLPRKGSYLVRAKHSKEVTEKVIHILDITDLEITEHANAFKQKINENYLISGGLIFANNQ